MAIQLPNPGLGDGQTGDNEYVMWTKVKDNFSNSAHAASRLVGRGVGNVVDIGTYGIANSGFYSGSAVVKDVDVDKPSANDKSAIFRYGNSTQAEFNYRSILNMPYAAGATAGTQLSFSISGTPRAWMRVSKGDASDVYTPVAEFYTTANTLKEEGTGHLYTSSPVILLRDGTMDKVHEAEDMDCELIKNGTGDYTLKNTTGLRENDWHAVPPKDVHGNPLCMIVVTEPKEGEVNVKTYKRKFDFELAAVVADLEQPFDIPKGASVRLHFNDLPEEQLDEPIE